MCSARLYAVYVFYALIAVSFAKRVGLNTVCSAMCVAFCVQDVCVLDVLRYVG